MDKNQFLTEAQEQISALTEKINALTGELDSKTGDLKEKAQAQEQLNKLLETKSELTNKFELLKNISEDKFEEAKKAFSDISDSISDNLQKGLDSLKGLF